jgi:hypothetical protein
MGADEFRDLSAFIRVIRGLLDLFVEDGNRATRVEADAAKRAKWV